MKIEKMPAFTKDVVNVIIETPKGSQNKFDFNPEFKVFTLKKSLPMGTVFPFDFGFIPNTKGQDGDPLDVLVIMDQPSYQGCHVQCRMIGVLLATQKESDGKEVQNNRFVAVPKCSILFGSLKDVKSLNKSMVEEIENFFIDYNKHEGKKFMPTGWKDGDHAMKMIKTQQHLPTGGLIANFWL